MKEKRLGWLEVQSKNKKVNATRRKLERMNKKVSEGYEYFIIVLLVREAYILLM